MPSLSASKRWGSGGRTAKRRCGMSLQSRSGGGGGMQTDGYEGSQATRGVALPRSGAPPRSVGADVQAAARTMSTTSLRTGHGVWMGCLARPGPTTRALPAMLHRNPLALFRSARDQRVSESGGLGHEAQTRTAAPCRAPPGPSGTASGRCPRSRSISACDEGERSARPQYPQDSSQGPLVRGRPRRRRGTAMLTPLPAADRRMRRGTPRPRPRPRRP